MITGNQPKGFTLLELLVVIAIIAILAAVVLTALNPAELMMRSRDAVRLNDLDMLRAAISAYTFDQSASSTFNLTADSGTTHHDFCKGGATKKVYLSTSAGAATTPPGDWTLKLATSTHERDSDGNGWVPINFSAVTLGIKLPVLPLDPVNSANDNVAAGSHFYYSYVCDKTNLTFTLIANMESNAFKNGGTQDAESKDGGRFSGLHESGSSLSIFDAGATTTVNWYQGQ